MISRKSLHLLAGLFALAAAGAVAAAPALPDTVRIIAINDFHGNIDGSNLTFRSDADGIFRQTTSTTRAGVPAGGVDFLAGLVRQLRSEVAASIVVSAGDLIGASPLDSALFHDEPAIETMNRLGLDFNAVGNHEFDEGRDELLRMQEGGCHPTDPNSCKGPLVGTPYPFEGAKFRFLAANVIDRQTGETLFPSVGIKHFRNLKVAFIGMTLKGTPSIVTPAGVDGLEFADEADTVNAIVPELRRAGIDVIVVLIHEGGFATGGIEGCAGISGPIATIVGRLDDAVDLVISGHTHQAYDCRLANRIGRTIPVTSAGSYGRLVTVVDLAIQPKSGNVVGVTTQNRLVDRSNFLQAANPIVPDAGIADIVARYNRIAAPVANRVIGSITAAITARQNAAGESALGDVIADAQLAATAPAAKGGAVVAFMNAGGIRGDLTYPSSSANEGDGNVTYGEAFVVQPFSNTLIVKTFTGQKIYDLLEQQWAATQPATGRILQVSRGFSYRTTYVSGASAPGGHYVCPGSVTIDGVPVDPAKTYRVTMNSFLATGGDGFGVFNAGTAQLGGDVDIDALAAWFASHAPMPLPPGPQDRIVQVAACL